MTPKEKMLPDAVKQFIVESFACFQTPTEIAGAVRERYGLELSRERVAHYDPDHSSEVAAKWRPIHAATRERFLSDTSRLAIAHQPFRLQELEKIYRDATKGKAKNLPLAMQALEQAAKEKGGVFTSARSVSIKDPDKVLADLLGVKPEDLP